MPDEGEYFPQRGDRITTQLALDDCRLIALMKVMRKGSHLRVVRRIIPTVEATRLPPLLPMIGIIASG